MKDEEFRKLLVEYAKEISDPENKKVCWFNLLSHHWNMIDRFNPRPKDLNEPFYSSVCNIMVIKDNGGWQL